MKTLIRNNETIKVQDLKIELYKNCGWKVVEELFTFKNKEEEDNEWMERFGD